MARASAARRMGGPWNLSEGREPLVAVEERGVFGVALVTALFGRFFRDGEPMPC